jgi:aminoglycoside phosphotransferase (APT) family kinase protein
LNSTVVPLHDARVSQASKARSREPVEIRTPDLAREPAVRAWRGLRAGNASPARLELLRNKWKSAVYRLPGVGRDGSDVIAKRCLWQMAVDERDAYEALAELGQPGVRYYGFLAEPEREYGWLFIEDARGEPFDPGDPEHRRLAARWLARLHTRSSRLAAGARLPERGPAHYLAHLRHARRRILESRGHPGIAAADREKLARMVGVLDFLEARWPEVSAACDALPRALVHGDFAERNARVRGRGAEGELFVFDWEVAGSGPPAVDLLQVDLGAYLETVRETWPGMDPPTLRRLAALGQLLRGGIAGASWEAESLVNSGAARAAHNLPIYLARMGTALEELGWA